APRALCRHLHANRGWCSGATPPLARQVAVEPVEHSGHPVDPPIRPSCDREGVELVGVEDVFDLEPKDAQRDEQLLVIAGRTSAIGLALEHEQWRPDARDIAQRRLPPQLEYPLV